jgi:glc operon protein GlcG
LERGALVLSSARSFAIAAVMGTCLCVSVQSQTPNGETAFPGEKSMAPPYGAPITLAQAQKVISAAEFATLRLHITTLAIAVVDTHGELVAFIKMDDAAMHSVAYAQLKARAAARVRRFTATPPPDIAAAVSTTPDFVGTPGGVPIVLGGRTIGAVGVSGGEDSDFAIAKAAAIALGTQP